MKKITVTLLYSFLLLMISCVKPDDVPNPTPTPNQNPSTDPAPNPVVNKTDTLGVGWSQQKLTDSILVDICFQDSLVGYVAGASIYKTKDGGRNWIKIQDTGGGVNLFVTGDGALHAISFSGSSYTKFTNWAQTTTTTLFGPDGGRGDDVYFPGNDIGFLTRERTLMKTTDGGNKWDPVTNIVGLFMDRYSSLFFLDSTKGWLFSYDRIYRTNGSITNWKICNIPSVGQFPSIHAVSANIVYAATNSGKIVKSIDGGQNFTQVATLPAASELGFTDIFFLDDLNGYACNGSRIYQTSDGAQTWTIVVKLESEFFELDFTDPKHGWACTKDGRVLKYRP